MTTFVEEDNMGTCLWIILSIIMAVTLLLLSVFEGKREELRENVVYPDGTMTAAVSNALLDPQEKLVQLESKIGRRHSKYEISKEKLVETRKTISELEITSDEVQTKYRKLLGELKSELAKTEQECQNLHTEIENITTRRDILKLELLKKQAEFYQESSEKLENKISEEPESVARKKESDTSITEQDLYPFLATASKSFPIPDSIFAVKSSEQHRTKSTNKPARIGNLARSSAS